MNGDKSSRETADYLKGYGIDMNKKLLLSVAAFFILYVLISFLSGFYLDYEWFSANKGLNIFMVLFFTSTRQPGTRVWRCNRS